MRAASLQEPELDAPADTAEGRRSVDALWRHLRAGVEVDGRACHLDAAAWARDLARQNAIRATGVAVIRFTVDRIRREPMAVRSELGVPHPPGGGARRAPVVTGPPVPPHPRPRPA